MTIGPRLFAFDRVDPRCFKSMWLLLHCNCNRYIVKPSDKVRQRLDRRDRRVANGQLDTNCRNINVSSVGFTNSHVRHHSFEGGKALKRSSLSDNLQRRAFGAVLFMSYAGGINVEREYRTRRVRCEAVKSVSKQRKGYCSICTILWPCQDAFDHDCCCD